MLIIFVLSFSPGCSVSSFIYSILFNPIIFQPHVFPGWKKTALSSSESLVLALGAWPWMCYGCEPCCTAAPLRPMFLSIFHCANWVACTITQDSVIIPTTTTSLLCVCGRVLVSFPTSRMSLSSSMVNINNSTLSVWLLTLVSLELAYSVVSFNFQSSALWFV